MNIILTGMKHCGKSSHGRLLAENLGWNFIDTDTLLEEYYLKAYCCSLSCREIYRKVGEKKFRELEHNLIDFMLSENFDSQPDTVIALGGGLITNPDVQPKLHQLGTVVFLNVPYDVLYERIIRKGLPPFLDPERPYESFIELCESREKHYIDNARLTIDLGNSSMKSASQCIIKNIKRYLNEQHNR